jgi:phage N-6-adenine-methyltransferase
MGKPMREAEFRPSVHHTSKYQEYVTPQAFVDSLPFNFSLDVCATEDNAKCDAYLSPEQDALTVPWSGVCFMNCPYKEAPIWVSHAAQEARAGAIVVCLLAARPDTKWFRVVAEEASLICFVVGRIKFEKTGVDKPDPAPFPSLLAVFGEVEDPDDCAEKLSEIGHVFEAGRDAILPCQKGY